MANSPTGTPGWFGWANAVISELVPIAALLTIRRRKRSGGPILYPMALLIAAAGLSLAAQLGVAVGHVGPSGWLLSAVPAIAFMALVKLVLAPVKASTPDTNTTEVASTKPTSITIPADDIPVAAPAVTEPATPVDGFAPEVPMHLIPTARFAVVNHEQTTGQAITADELAARLSITPATAGQLLATINPPATLPARINGAPIGGEPR
ncbi:hypothetical protein [Micromonospora sp. CPCC 206061]|uniref:hypothetical protein n=1 Tax=Micromonospora sp. CPCC 206061 TaxID=3122410 RepID=UPI003FA5563A